MVDQKKLEKLTPLQEKQCEEFRQKWFKIGSCTDPADFPKAEAAIKEMYKLSDLEEPQFIHVKSPFEGILIAAGYDYKQYNAASETAQKQMMDAMRPKIYEAWWGQMESHWIAFYLFPALYLGVEYEEKSWKTLNLWKDIAESASWWWAYANVAIICDRPKEIHWEPDVARPRIHNPDGPAVLFRDGLALYAWYGMPLPGWILETPEKITIKNIQEEQNVEIRRVLIEKYGPARYMMDMKAECVHKDNYGELYRCPVPNDDDILMVKVRDATPESNGSHKETLIPVDPNAGIETAKAAVAWTFSMTEDEYDPVMET